MKGDDVNSSTQGDPGPPGPVGPPGNPGAPAFVPIDVREPAIAWASQPY